MGQRLGDVFASDGLHLNDGHGHIRIRNNNADVNFAANPYFERSLNTDAAIFWSENYLMRHGRLPVKRCTVDS